MNKKPITVLITKIQAEKLRIFSKNTGNSQISIVRTALEEYFNSNRGWENTT